MDPDRAAVLGGRVYDRDTGAAIAGVNVTILGQAEAGRTRTRTVSGGYEILVNGGGPVTVRLEHPQYFTVDRTIEVSWDMWAAIPDVAMVPLSELQCTSTIDAASLGTTGGVFTGPTRTDERGTRSIAFYVPPTTSVIHAAGTNTAFQICSGEYTLRGMTDDPTEAMPVELPASTSYTYATALEVVLPGASPLNSANHLAQPHFDNTVCAGPSPPAACGTSCSPTVACPAGFYCNGSGTCDATDRIYFYLRADSFISVGATDTRIQPGEIVPNGLYERDTATWTADDNGIVIDLTAAETGCMSTGMVANPVPVAEQDRVCGSLPAGRYWRVPIERFSLHDLNYYAAPDAPVPEADVSGGDEDPGCSTTVGGSVIHCEAQTLGEIMPIAGTPFSLTYLSDHQRGRRERYIARVRPLNPANLPPELPTNPTAHLR